MEKYRVWDNEENRWLVTELSIVLYDGGWRADCKEELMEIEGFDEEEAEEVCEAMRLCEIFVARKKEED